mmetsp:Transcript_17904/g.31769  ORF Transcript_17904/g.31769 Transcript_17904/m.31769 type:complete len:336 (-) Transcript_17904:841-1848(-)
MGVGGLQVDHLPEVVDGLIVLALVLVALGALVDVHGRVGLEADGIREAGDGLCVPLTVGVCDSHVVVAVVGILRVRVKLQGLVKVIDCLLVVPLLIERLPTQIVQLALIRVDLDSFAQVNTGILIILNIQEALAAVVEVFHIGIVKFDGLSQILNCCVVVLPVLTGHGAAVVDLCILAAKFKGLVKVCDCLVVPAEPQEGLAPVKIVDAVVGPDVDGFREGPNREVVVQQVTVHQPQTLIGSPISRIQLQHLREALHGVKELSVNVEHQPQVKQGGDEVLVHVQGQLELINCLLHLLHFLVNNSFAVIVVLIVGHTADCLIKVVDGLVVLLDGQI